MPQPTNREAHVNRPLTQMSLAMIQDEGNFVAGQVFKTIPTEYKSDSYYTYDRAYWNSDEMQERASATESSGSGYKIDADATFKCRWKAFHKDIPYDVERNADPGIDLNRDAVKYVTLKYLIHRERIFASTYMATGVWTSDLDGVASSPTTNQVLQWNDINSTPIQDVWDMKEAILGRTGFEPNTLVLGYPVWKELVNHPTFVDRVKYGNTSGVAMIDTSEMAQLFKVERVLVMKGIVNTALENATAAHSFIGGKKALLCYSPATPGLLTPAAGYTFAWKWADGANVEGAGIERFEMPLRKASRVEINAWFDIKLVAADLGAFWDTIVA